MLLTDPARLDELDFDKGDGLVPLVAQHADTGEVLMLGYADRAALEASLADGLLTFHSRSRQAIWRKGETSGNTLRVLDLHADCDADAVLARVLPDGPTCHTGARSCFGAPPVLAELDDVIAARARPGHGTPGAPEERGSGGPGGATERGETGGRGDTGERSETSRRGETGGRSENGRRSETGEDDVAPTSYTRRLLADRNLRLKKLGEEAVELALACADAAAGPDGARAPTEPAGASAARQGRDAVAAEAADLVYHTLVACRGAGLGLADVVAELRRRRATPAASRGEP